MVKEFRDFVFRGNIIELAIAVVLAGAFALVVGSLVNDIITPLVGVLGLPDFSTLSITLGSGTPPAEIMYGKFIQALLQFVVIAAVIFFAIIKPMNAIRDRAKKPEAPAAPAGPTETDLLKDILAELKKRP